MLHAVDANHRFTHRLELSLGVELLEGRGVDHRQAQVFLAEAQPLVLQELRRGRALVNVHREHLSDHVLGLGGHPFPKLFVELKLALLMLLWRRKLECEARREQRAVARATKKEDDRK